MAQTLDNSTAVAEGLDATGSGHCPSCGNTARTSQPPSFVYSVGRIAMRAPRLSVEKELAQVSRGDDTAGLTHHQTLHAVLSKPENRYLLRQMCWIMTVQGLETYLLLPRDPADYSLLLDTVQPTPSPLSLDLVIGLKGPIAPPDFCNGLMIPIVAFDQIYSFDRNALIKSIPRPKKAAGEHFGPAAEELFDRIMQVADNAGATDDHRALNYLVVRYPRIYEAVAEAYSRDESLSGVETRLSSLSSTRKIVEVIFSFTHRTTQVVSKEYVRVDATEEFPFLVTPLSAYYDR